MAVVKVIELVGSSTEGWEDAARNALTGAAKSLHGIMKVEVMRWTAEVADGRIVSYQAEVKVSFVVD
jgi:flavin-binding protein dodecin